MSTSIVMLELLQMTLSKSLANVATNDEQIFKHTLTYNQTRNLHFGKRTILFS